MRLLPLLALAPFAAFAQWQADLESGGGDGFGIVLFFFAFFAYVHIRDAARDGQPKSGERWPPSLRFWWRPTSSSGSASSWPSTFWCPSFTSRGRSSRGSGSQAAHALGNHMTLLLQLRQPCTLGRPGHGLIGLDALGHAVDLG